jgi:nucleotide-binding universal stress UspA family protein
MTIRKILVPLQGEENDSVALESAMTIARDASAKVEAMFIRHDPREVLAYTTNYPGMLMVEHLMAGVEERNRKCGEIASRVFENAVAPHRSELSRAGTKFHFAAEYTDRIGVDSDLVTRHGRVSDLVVLSAPSAGEASNDSEAVNAALRFTGKPALLVPSRITSPFPRRIGIAWNGSMEAARALSFAAPFIDRAEGAEVFIIEDAATQDLRGEDVLDYLACHGLNGKITRLTYSADKSEADVLLTACLKHEIDLIILGAYTHGNLHRLVFGGVTRDIVGQTKIPLLMAH